MKKILITIAAFFSILICASNTVYSKNKIPSNWITTNSKNSYVVLNKTTHFLTSKNKSTKKTIKKHQGLRIYYLRYGDNEKVYYAGKDKRWIPSSSTYGTVWYNQNDGSQMILSTNKKGKLSYQVYAPYRRIKLVLKKNAYIYNSRGLLEKGTVKMLKKGKKLTAYSVQKIGKIKYYVTNYGWINTHNAKVIKNKK